MTYRAQARRSIYWVTVARVVSKMITSFEGLLLARLLWRSTLGLVAIADLAVSALLLFQELGFNSALIYRRDRTEEAADTAFIAVLGSSAALYLIAVAAAAPMARFLSTDAATASRVVPVLRALALTIPISALGQVQLALMAKALDFKRKVIPEVVSAAVGTAIVVPLAFTGRGVWAIVYGRVAECITLSVLAWVLSPWRPRLRLNLTLAGEMFDYAKHVIGSQVLIFFITHIDDAFVSRFLGSYPLAGYGLAYKLSNMPATEVTRLFGQVMFPAFSKMQDNVAELRAVFLRTTRYIAYVSIPVSVCIAVFCDDFLDFAYGDKFIDIVWPLRALVVYGLIRSIAANMGGIFKAGGKPNWLFGIAAVRLGVMAVLLYPATVGYGILGVSVLSALVAVVDFAASAWLVNRIIGARLQDYVEMLLPALLIAGAAGIVSDAIYPRLASMKGYFSLPLAGACMLGLYGVVLWLIDGDARRMVDGMLNDVVQRGRLILRPRES